jgi:YD repeat-containing protein
MLSLQEASYCGETRTDVQGHFAVERLEYDAFGRLIVWKPTLQGFGLNRKEVPTVRYEYYPSGELKKRVAPSGVAVEIEYDRQKGHPLTFRLLSRSNSQEVLVLRRDMVYDAEGFLLRYQDARGEKYEFRPDAFGRPFASLRPDGRRTETIRDALGRLVHYRVMDHQGRILDEMRFEYDLSGRLVQVQRRRTGHTPLMSGL